MRITTLFALVACLISLAASQANAVSLIRIDYVGGSTAAAGSGGDSVAANVSDLLSFDVSVDVDSGQLAVLAFDMDFVSSDDLKISQANWETGTVFTSFAPTTSILLGIPLDASSGTTGRFSNFGWTTGSPTGPFAASTNVFIGTVVFHVTAATNSNIQLGLFNPITSIGQDGSLAFITPDFQGFAVIAPEPGSTALLAAGIGAMIAMNLRRRTRS